jgi:hypothetical protein
MLMGACSSIDTTSQVVNSAGTSAAATSERISAGLIAKHQAYSLDGKTLRYTADLQEAVKTTPVVYSEASVLDVLLVDSKCVGEFSTFNVDVVGNWIVWRLVLNDDQCKQIRKIQGKGIFSGSSLGIVAKVDDVKVPDFALVTSADKGDSGNAVNTSVDAPNVTVMVGSLVDWAALEESPSLNQTVDPNG